MSKQTIGQFLATLRKANGLTQVEVAEKLGISNRTLSAWECDTALPDILLLPALANLYNVTVDEIVAGQRKTNQGGQIAVKAQNKMLQRAIAKLSLPSLILTGLVILAIALFFVGLYTHLTTIAWTGWRWWLLLLFGGAIMAIVCVIILLALFVSTKANADDEIESYPYFCMLLNKKLSLCLYSIAITFALCFVIGLILPFATSNAKFTMMLIALVGGLVFALGGLLSFHATLKQKGNQQQLNQLRASDKKLKKLSLWGLILVGVVVAFGVLEIVLSTAPVYKRETVFEATSRGEFITELECYTFDKEQYKGESFYSQLPNSGNYYLNVVGNVHKDYCDFGNGFYGQYLKEQICILYCLIDTDNDGAKDRFVVDHLYRYWAEDASLSVFVAKYCHYPVNPEGGMTFEIVQSNGVFSLLYVQDHVEDFVFGSYASIISTALATLYYLVIFVIASANCHKIKIKL